mmetsp:Transcript_100970/g.261410  ORF Transcript_100970/g.261410 Transcript_100970/m.261410 type:complete len:506 (+) Transcript_100970:231-1748(+)
MAPGVMKWVPKTDKPAEGEELAGASVGDASEGRSGDRFESEGEGKSNGKGKAARSGGAKRGQSGKDSEPARPQQQQKGGKSGKGDRGWNDGKGDASGGKGDKGGGKAGGKGGKGGKDMGKGGKKGGKMDFGMATAGVKTMHEVEAEISKTQVSRTQQVRRPRGPTAFTKQPIDAKGAHCEVHKHSGMGCAVVSMESFTAREAIISYVESKYGGSKDVPPKVDIGGVIVQMRRHTDKTTQREVITDLFVAWGHKQEKEAPLACDDIADFCDRMYEEAQRSPAAAQVMGAAQQPQHPLAVAPQQVLGMGGRPLQQQQPHPGVPPPPAQAPSVGAPQQQMVAQGVPGQAYYQDYQRAAAYNQWMSNYGMNQYYPPQHQHAYQQQQAVSHAMHQQQMRQMHMQQQMQQQPQQQMQQQHPQQAMQQQQHMQPVMPQPMSPQAGQMPPLPVAPGEAGVAPPSTPQRPKIVPIVDPSTGKSIDTMGMNFEPRKPKSPLKIIDPASGENVAPA